MTLREELLYAILIEWIGGDDRLSSMGRVLEEYEKEILQLRGRIRELEDKGIDHELHELKKQRMIAVKALDAIARYGEGDATVWPPFASESVDLQEAWRGMKTIAKEALVKVDADWLRWKQLEGPIKIEGVIYGKDHED